MDGISERDDPLREPSGCVPDILLRTAHRGSAAGQVILQVIGILCHMELYVSHRGDVSHGVVGIGRPAVYGVGHGHQVVQEVVAVPGD